MYVYICKLTREGVRGCTPVSSAALRHALYCISPINLHKALCQPWFDRPHPTQSYPAEPLRSKQAEIILRENQIRVPSMLVCM